MIGRHGETYICWNLFFTIGRYFDCLLEKVVTSFASPNIFHSSDYDFENVSGDSSTARWIICMSGRKSPLME